MQLQRVPLRAISNKFRQHARHSLPCARHQLEHAGGDLKAKGQGCQAGACEPAHKPVAVRSDTCSCSTGPLTGLPLQVCVVNWIRSQIKDPAPT